MVVIIRGELRTGRVAGSDTGGEFCGCPPGNNGTSRIVKCDAGGYQLGLGMLPPNIPLGCPRNRFLFRIRDAAEGLAPTSCLIFLAQLEWLWQEGRVTIGR